MSNSDLCPVCGNSIPAGASECPWCEHQLSPHKSASAKRQLIKTVNIKSDLPDISTAHSRLINALHGAKAQRVRVLKLIHGYGSSGKGGDIFFLVREYLERDKYSGVFKYYVPGENFAPGYSEAQKLVRDFPQLKNDSDWKKSNKGVTLVAMR